jgi:hypothetical protein
MSKTRKNKKNYLRKLSRTGKKAIPIVKTELKKVGKTAKVVAVRAAPVVEKGISNIYGTIMKGFNLGVKGVRRVSKRMSRKSRKSRR